MTKQELIFKLEEEIALNQEHISLDGWEKKEAAACNESLFRVLAWVRELE